MLKIYHIIAAFLFYLGKPNKLHSIFLNLIDQAHGPKTYRSSRLVSLTLVGQTKDKLVYGLWPWGQLPLRNIKSVVNTKKFFIRESGHDIVKWNCSARIQIVVARVIEYAMQHCNSMQFISSTLNSGYLMLLFFNWNICCLLKTSAVKV